MSSGYLDCNELISWIIIFASLLMKLTGKSTENLLATACILLNLICSYAFTISIKDTIRIIRYGGRPTCPTRVIEYANLYNLKLALYSAGYQLSALSLFEKAAKQILQFAESLDTELNQLKFFKSVDAK